MSSLPMLEASIRRGQCMSDAISVVHPSGRGISAFEYSLHERGGYVLQRTLTINLAETAILVRRRTGD